MTMTRTHRTTMTGGALTIQGDVLVTANVGLEPIDTTIAAGDAGTITRSDSDTAVFTRTSGSNVEDGDVVDVYGTGWRRHGCTATANGTSGESFVLDGGQEVEDTDDFPATADTAVVVCPRTAFEESFVGNSLQMIGVSATKRAIVTFLNSTTVLLSRDIAAGGAWTWVTGSGTNPFAGLTVTSVAFSCGDATYSTNVKLDGCKS